MNIKMNPSAFQGYKSASQKARKITESWASENIYCPFCGCPKVMKFENNKPVADFFCPHCKEEYELKSKSGVIKNRVDDGAYQTMIDRISAFNNPNFFFLQYDRAAWTVRSLVMVPKYFFSPDIIIKRKPLADTARRRGWVGCNILFSGIPERGKVRVIENGRMIPPEKVVEKVNEIRFVSAYNMERRGWMLETLKCIERIPNREFTLKEVYQFVPELEKKYPNNHHIPAKLRQQIQALRDSNIIVFHGRGVYQKRD